MTTAAFEDYMAQQPSTPELIEYRVAMLEARRVKDDAVAETVIRLGDAMLEIKRDLDRGHTRMNEQDEELDGQSERISVVENTLPVLKEYGEWVKRAAFGIYGILGALIVGIILAVVTWLLTRGG
jgi:hypothetical protein